MMFTSITSLACQAGPPKSIEEKRSDQERRLQRYKAFSSYLPRPGCCTSMAYLTIGAAVGMGALGNMVMDASGRMQDYFSDPRVKKRLDRLVNFLMKNDGFQDIAIRNLETLVPRYAKYKQSLLKAMNHPAIYQPAVLLFPERFCVEAEAEGFSRQFCLEDNGDEVLFTVEDPTLMIEDNPDDIGWEMVLSPEFMNKTTNSPTFVAAAAAILFFALLVATRLVLYCMKPKVDESLFQLSPMISRGYKAADPNAVFDVLAKGEDPSEQLRGETVYPTYLLTDQQQGAEGPVEAKQEAPRAFPKPERKIIQRRPGKQVKRTATREAVQVKEPVVVQKFNRFKVDFIEATRDEVKVVVPIVKDRSYVAVSIPKSEFDSVYSDYTSKKQATQALMESENRGFCRSKGQKGIKRGKGGQFHLKTLGSSGDIRDLVGKLSDRVDVIEADGQSIRIMYLTLHKDKSAGRKLHK